MILDIQLERGTSLNLQIHGFGWLKIDTLQRYKGTLFRLDVLPYCAIKHQASFQIPLYSQPFAGSLLSPTHSKVHRPLKFMTLAYPQHLNDTNFAMACIEDAICFFMENLPTELRTMI